MTNKEPTPPKESASRGASAKEGLFKFQGNTVEIIQSFLGAMRQSGIDLDGEIVADGVLHRAHIVGQKPGSFNCAYVLHIDGRPAGYFQDMSRQGSKQTWRYQCEINGSNQVKINPAALRAARQKGNDEQERRHNAAALKAMLLWSQSKPAPANHPYLIRKDIRAHGIRSINGDLVIPLKDSQGNIHTLQFIKLSGEKRFLSGGKKQGNFYAIKDGSKSTVSPLVIAEGFATAASIHEHTGYTVLVAFDSGNLVHVAKAVQWAAVGRKIIIAGDNDESGVGQAAARAAAEAVGGQVMIPRLPGDWNDWKESIVGPSL